MAESESFLEFDQVDDITISAFVKLQAFVRGFMVRRLLCDIRKEYEDIVKDIDKDLEVSWPRRFGIPSVNKRSKCQNHRGCGVKENNESYGNQKNDINSSLKFIGQSEQGSEMVQDKSTFTSSGNFSRVQFAPHKIESCEGWQSAVVVEYQKEMGIRRDASHLSSLSVIPSAKCSPMTQFSNENSRKEDSNYNRAQLDKNESNMRDASVFTTNFERAVKPDNDISNSHHSNINSGPHTHIVIQRREDVDGDINKNMKEIVVSHSKWDQGTQIDSPSSVLTGDHGNGNVRNDKQVQVEMSEFEIMESAGDVVQDFRGDSGDQTRVCVGSRKSSFSTPAVADANVGGDNYFQVRDDLDVEVLAEDGRIGGSSSDKVAEINSFGAGDEILENDINVVNTVDANQELVVSDVLSCSNSVSDKSIECYGPTSSCSVAEEALRLQPLSENSRLNSNIMSPSANSLEVQDKSSVLHSCDDSITDADVKSIQEEKVDDVTNADDLGALPSDKSSLLKLKKTLTMELLWIQQAINSRKHYLRLKPQLVV